MFNYDSDDCFKPKYRTLVIEYNAYGSCSAQFESRKFNSLSFHSKKYNNLEDILDDEEYCKWLLSNEWFKGKREFRAVSESLKINKFSPTDYEIISAIIAESHKLAYTIKYTSMIHISMNQNFLHDDEITNIIVNTMPLYDHNKVFTSKVYFKENNNGIFRKLDTKYTFRLIKIDLEELCKEAFKPSRVQYRLLLDPNYEE